LKATRNASVPPLAPKNVAIVMSRNSPKTLDKSVIPPTVKVDRSSFVLRMFSLLIDGEIVLAASAILNHYFQMNEA